jgi:hypothetical protein
MLKKQSSNFERSSGQKFTFLWRKDGIIAAAAAAEERRQI